MHTGAAEYSFHDICILICNFCVNYLQDVVFETHIMQSEELHMVQSLLFYSLQALMGGLSNTGVVHWSQFKWPKYRIQWFISFATAKVG